MRGLEDVRNDKLRIENAECRMQKIEYEKETK